MITPELIQRLGYAGMPVSTAATWALALQSAAARFGVIGSLRQAHWLAQLMHESGGLRFTREVWGPTPAQRRYEGRQDLGNTKPGDGLRYLGRGPIQLTGRANYRAAGLALGLPLEDKPQLVEQPDVGALVAARYFATRTLHGKTLLQWADTGSDYNAIFKVSQGVNGLNKQGLPNHLEERRAWFNRVWQALQVPPKVILIDQGGKEVLCTPGPDVRYAGTVIDQALIENLRVLYAVPGGPFQYSPGLNVWVRKNGDLVLERALNIK